MPDWLNFMPEGLGGFLFALVVSLTPGSQIDLWPEASFSPRAELTK